MRDIVDASGNELDHVVYDSFGNIVTETNAANGDRFKFAGMQYDTATGLYYDHARYYAAAIGRFTSQDPKGFAAGDANIYRYVENDPTNLIDPTGLDDKIDQALEIYKKEIEKEATSEKQRRAFATLQTQIKNNPNFVTFDFDDGGLIPKGDASATALDKNGKPLGIFIDPRYRNSKPSLITFLIVHETWHVNNPEQEGERAERQAEGLAISIYESMRTDPSLRHPLPRVDPRKLQ